MSQKSGNNQTILRTCMNGGSCADRGWGIDHAEAGEWHTHPTSKVQRCPPTVAGGLLGNRHYELNTVARALPH